MTTNRSVTAPLVPIAEFCETGSGGTPSRAKGELYFGGPIPWVKSGELRENTIVRTDETITALGLRESAAKVLPRGTLLVALYGATVGRVGLLGIEAATNQAICHIIPDQRRADRQYLFYALQSQVPTWLSRRVGGGQPNISQGIIRETLIPLPPLEDQKRIAYLLSKVEGLITQRKQHLQQLDDLLKSVFDDMFGNHIQNEGAYDVITNACDFVDYRGKTPPRVDRGVPLISAKCVRQGFFDAARLDYITEETYQKIMTRGFPVAGDVLFTTEGATFGFTCRIPESFTKFAVGQRLITMKCKDGYHPIVLDFVLNNQHVQKKLASRKSGSAALGIRSAELAKVEIPFPPAHDQEQFARIVEKTEPLIDALQSSVKDLEKLYAVLSQCAFKGELDLSRVVLPVTDISDEIQIIASLERTTEDTTFELPTPANLRKLGNNDGRKTVLERWLNAYAMHIGKQSFSTDSFMKLVREKLSDLQSKDDAPEIDYELSATDYDHVKDWIFQQLKGKRLKQDYDDANNRDQIFLAKD